MNIFALSVTISCNFPCKHYGFLIQRSHKSASCVNFIRAALKADLGMSSEKAIETCVIELVVRHLSKCYSLYRGSYLSANEEKR